MGDEKLHHLPQSEPFWSLPMTLAWIMWRSEEMVRRCWNEHRRAERKSEISLLDVVNSFNLADNSLFEPDEPRPDPQFEAFDNLLSKLENGDLPARGSRTINAPKQDIPGDEWTSGMTEICLGGEIVRRAHNLSYWSGGSIGDAIGRPGDQTPSWYNVRVPSRNVLMLWPPIETQETVSIDLQELRLRGGKTPGTVPKDPTRVCVDGAKADETVSIDRRREQISGAKAKAVFDAMVAAAPPHGQRPNGMKVKAFRRLVAAKLEGVDIPSDGTLRKAMDRIWKIIDRPNQDI